MVDVVATSSIVPEWCWISTVDRLSIEPMWEFCTLTFLLPHRVTMLLLLRRCMSHGRKSRRKRVPVIHAIGKGNEKIRLEPVDAGDSLAYYRDADGVQFVPKIRWEQLIIE